jgi:hypothetical protein
MSGAPSKAHGEHFDPDAEAKIHTSRDNRADRCVGGDNSQCGRKTKTCDYGNKLPKLALQPEAGRGFSQVHHLLCVAEVNGYHGSDKERPHAKEEDIDAAYKPTEWCISHTSNLIRLPHKKFYRVVFLEKKTAAPAQAPLLPCHDVDHVPYLKEVTTEIEKRIWNQVGEVQKDGKCFNETHALTQFKSLSDVFRKRLEDRAQRGDKVPGVLAKMEKGKSYSDRNLGKFWWLPFSMAVDEKAQANPLYDLDPVTKPDTRVIERRQKVIAAMKGH